MGTKDIVHTVVLKPETEDLEDFTVKVESALESVGFVEFEPSALESIGIARFDLYTENGHSLRTTLYKIPNRGGIAITYREVGATITYIGMDRETRTMVHDTLMSTRYELDYVGHIENPLH